MVSATKKGVEDLYFEHKAAMALLRGIFWLIELAGALLMLKLNQIDLAMRINALTAIVEPMITLLIVAIGIKGLAGKIPLHKVLFIVLGVGMIFYGT